MPDRDADQSSADQSRAEVARAAPFDFEGDCVVCAQRSAHLNRDGRCRRCVVDPDGPEQRWPEPPVAPRT